MKNRVIFLLFLLTFQHGLAIVDDFFSPRLVQKSSFGIYTINSTSHPMDSLQCGSLCLKSIDPTCTAFSIEQDCRLSPASALVETGSNSDEVMEAYVSSSLPSVPHFLIVHTSGAIEDYSIDPVVSPPITVYYSSFAGGGIDVITTMTDDLTFLGKSNYGATPMYRWYFDSKVAVSVAEFASTGYYWKGPKASQNRIIFCNGGHYEVDKTEVFKDGSWSFGKSNKNCYGCATFVPGDDNFVYVIGGWEGCSGSAMNKITRYDIEADKYNDMLPMNHTYHDLGCTGVVASDGTKYVITAGGHKDNGAATNESLIYNVGENTWEAFPDLPYKVTKPGLKAAGTRVYLFGGLVDGSLGTAMVHYFDIDKIGQETEWTPSHDMTAGSNHIHPLPYNLGP